MAGARSQWSYLGPFDQSSHRSNRTDQRPFQKLIGSRSHCASSMIPTQPVTVRVHSADASSHLNRLPRTTRMHRTDELPSISEFSMDSILASVTPEIDDTIDAIAEILGKSKLSLANQYDSHLPPQGDLELHTEPALVPVEEAHPSDEHSSHDNVIIVPEDASLVEGSQAGSAAYGLLERLLALPSARQHEVQPSPSYAPRDGVADQQEAHRPNANTSLLRYNARSGEPVFSETHLLANANAETDHSPNRCYQRTGLDGLDSMESSHYYPPEAAHAVCAGYPHNLASVTDIRGLTTWLYGDRQSTTEMSGGAESKLRTILNQQARAAADGKIAVDHSVS